MLAALDVESFESYKSGLIGKLLEKELSLSYEINKFWGQIVDKRYMFDLSEKESEVLGNIQKDDIIEWYRTYLKRPSINCRRLAIRVWGCNSASRDADTEMISEQNIKDVEGFKKLCTFYPSMC